MAERRIPELSAIDIRGTEDVAAYVKALRDLLRDLTYEIDFTADEMRAVLERSGGTALDRFAARAKARKVTRRLRRAGILTHGAAIETVKFWAAYRVEYEALIHPSSNRQTWEW